MEIIDRRNAERDGAEGGGDEGDETLGEGDAGEDEEEDEEQLEEEDEVGEAVEDEGARGQTMLAFAQEVVSLLFNGDLLEDWESDALLRLVQNGNTAVLEAFRELRETNNWTQLYDRLMYTHLLIRADDSTLI
jgi:hypothetical protein